MHALLSYKSVFSVLTCCKSPTLATPAHYAEMTKLVQRQIQTRFSGLIDPVKNQIQIAMLLWNLYYIYGIYSCIA